MRGDQPSPWITIGPFIMILDLKWGPREAGAQNPSHPAVKSRPLPVVAGRSAVVDDVAHRLGALEHRADGDAARAGHRHPDRPGLHAARTEPVLAARVLEVQAHVDGRVLPQERA